MIGALRTWLLSIIAAGLVLSILYALLPKGRLRPIVRTAGGVVLMLVIRVRWKQSGSTARTHLELADPTYADLYG